ncbi:MAG: glutamine-hydrolyzing GMP synthase [candidate division WOR-3 bacterium]|nr:glutamine-hydrolyzing GMP synthase [candidate division WOR-3 bacterium]
MDKIIVIDFGGQYSHLIARRIREFGVYAEVMPPTISAREILQDSNIKGIVFSGGAASVTEKNSPKCTKDILTLGIPILGICYGHHLIAYLENGKVTKGNYGEYGPTPLFISKKSLLFDNLKNQTSVWMNHRDFVIKLPSSYIITANTPYSKIAAFENPEKKIYGVQFHPEVTHTENGKQILKNFIFKICHAKIGWRYHNIIDTIKNEIKEVIGNRKALIGLSGGRSSTAAILVKEVIGDNLLAVYVDSGLMRAGETEFIIENFSKFNLNLRLISAHKRFFRRLKGITNPEEKRKIIGKLFIDIFEEVAHKENIKVLIQGTIYSDRIESGFTKHSATIKSHHNVGGLPQKLSLEIYEPLRNLYKDEVRKIARKLGLGNEIIKRHVFPGPGLAIRVLGEVTPTKVDIVRRATKIIEDELKKFGLYEKFWMAFGVLLPIKSVGIQGDARTYKYPLVIRIVQSQDAMTANFAKISYKVLEQISTRITNEISEINRVVYDITNKPPATMEWE